MAATFESSWSYCLDADVNFKIKQMHPDISFSYLCEVDILSRWVFWISVATYTDRDRRVGGLFLAQAKLITKNRRRQINHGVMLDRRQYEGELQGKPVVGPLRCRHPIIRQNGAGDAIQSVLLRRRVGLGFLGIGGREGYGSYELHATVPFIPDSPAPRNLISLQNRWLLAGLPSTMSHRKSLESPSSAVSRYSLGAYSTKRCCSRVPDG